MTSIVLIAVVNYFVELVSTSRHLGELQKARTSGGFKGKFRGGFHHGFAGKASGVFQVLSEVDAMANSNVLHFSVKANQDVSAARLKWHLPASAMLIKGELESIVADFKRGEIRKFDLEIQSLGDTPVFAEIYTNVGGFKMGATAPFASKSIATTKDDTGQAHTRGLHEDSKFIQ